MVERHPVQKFKVTNVEPTTQNCDGTSIRLKKNANGINACAEKTLPSMVGIVFLASKVQRDSLGIQT